MKSRPDITALAQSPVVIEDRETSSKQQAILSWIVKSKAGQLYFYVYIPELSKLFRTKIDKRT